MLGPPPVPPLPALPPELAPPLLPAAPPAPLVPPAFVAPPLLVATLPPALAGPLEVPPAEEPLAPLPPEPDAALLPPAALDSEPPEPDADLPPVPPPEPPNPLSHRHGSNAVPSSLQTWKPAQSPGPAQLCEAPGTHREPELESALHPHAKSNTPNPERAIPSMTRIVPHAPGSINGCRARAPKHWSRHASRATLPAAWRKRRQTPREVRRNPYT